MTFPDDEIPYTAPAEPGEPAATAGCAQCDCLCGGTGPAMSRLAGELLRHYGPSPKIRRHFDQARIEILKGLRAMLDEHIDGLQRGDAAPRGSRVSVD